MHDPDKLFGLRVDIRDRLICLRLHPCFQDLVKAVDVVFGPPYFKMRASKVLNQAIPLRF